eukprot:15453345-Alexandrium_andersonii.AAC.1
MSAGYVGCKGRHRGGAREKAAAPREHCRRPQGQPSQLEHPAAGEITAGRRPEPPQLISARRPGKSQPRTQHTHSPAAGDRVAGELL